MSGCPNALNGGPEASPVFPRTTTWTLRRDVAEEAFVHSSQGPLIENTLEFLSRP